MLEGDARVASFIRDLTWDDLPRAVREQLKYCTLDLLGAIIAGTLTRVSRIVAREALAHWPGEAASLIFFNARASLPGAAMANAFTANALDIDDGYRWIKGHPGAVVFPAVLAAAEYRGTGSREFLTALAAAYEVAIRAGLAWHHYHPGYHASGSWGSLGAAAGAARLLGLSEDGIASALGAAEYHAPIAPMMRCIEHPAMTKDGIGWGAMVGTVSALLAASGFTGISPLLGLDQYRHLVESLGREYKILNLYFKPYACCRWAQPAIFAALKLRGQHRFEPQDIERITVRSFEAATRLQREPPANTEEAQYNLAYPIAAALVDGEVGPRQVLDGRLQRREILDLAARVVAVSDAALERQFPGKCHCELELLLRDGRTLCSGAGGAPGDPDNPLGAAGIEEKFVWLAGSVLDSGKVEKIMKLVRQLDEAEENLALLLDLLRSPENS